MIEAQKEDLGAINGPWRLPYGWRWMRIKDICVVNPSRPKLIRDLKAPTSFVPMAAIDEIDGVISTMEVRQYEEVNHGFTYFAENDVLFAKITPSMQNGKCAIAQGLIDNLGFGSTEFHVLRPGLDVTSKWLHYFLRRKDFRGAAEEHFVGAVGQQRVPPEYIASSLIPVPSSINTQNRIISRVEALLVI